VFACSFELNGKPLSNLVLDQLSDFHLLRTKLQSKPAESVPGTDLKAYGLVVVS